MKCGQAGSGRVGGKTGLAAQTQSYEQRSNISPGTVRRKYRIHTVVVLET